MSEFDKKAALKRYTELSQLSILGKFGEQEQQETFNLEAEADKAGFSFHLMDGWELMAKTYPLPLTNEEMRALGKAIEHRLDEFEFDGATQRDEEEIALLKGINDRIAGLTDYDNRNP